MEAFQSYKLLSYISILFILQFCCSFSYSLPDHYFINCGSSSSVIFSGRTFTGDEKSPRSYRFSSGNSKAVKDSNLSASELYQTARIFRRSSQYEFNIDENGTYVVRFHFFPFSSLGNLDDARFNILAYGSPILSNFTVNNTSFPVIQEFFLTVPVGKLRIGFVPYEKHCFAFVNAIEVFIAPIEFIPEGGEKDYNGSLKSPLHVIQRINVGGDNITPNDDTLLRYWLPDDVYLVNKNTARNSEVYDKINYQSGGSTVFDAPASVYRTAKEMNIDSNSHGTNNFKISWHFSVQKRAKHLVRVHFCDIVSRTTNENLTFNLYINSEVSQEIWPFGVIPEPAAPFYIDFVVDSDDSGFMLITVRPNSRSSDNQAFLNGVEIMELIEGFTPQDSDSNGKNLFIIIGSCVGGVVFLGLTILIILCFGLKRRKWKPIDTFDWLLVHFHGGSSHSRTTVKIPSSGSVHSNLNLGLKIPFSEILYATRRFDTELMIGEGGFGKVYRGMLRNGTKVALKRSEPGHGQGLSEFQTEIIVLSKIHHHNLVSLIGYCDEQDEMILVYEFMEMGTLRDHLYTSEGESKELTSRSKLSWEQRLGICIGAAKGLNYLHTSSSGAIIHRDIKSTNILLDEHYVAKVADFGLSRLDPLDQTHVTTDVKGSFGYLDPEYFRCLQLTQKSDVFSFGVVLLEVLCARPVIDHSLPGEQVSLADWGTAWQRKGELDKIIDPFLVGKINPNCLRKFGETVEKCLQEYGVDRPNMVDVLWDLDYCLQLQHMARVREPYEVSTTDIGLLLPVVQRLPSSSVEIGEDELHHESYDYSDAGEVFPQLKLEEARLL